jgi:dTDP-4-amino-4,6-dideoxygalactose transaminase
MSNGTSATHCLFLSIKFKYPDINKIYVSNNSYVAAYNCALMVYDITKIEVMKMNINTWNIDINEEYILSLYKNSAVLIVHNIGNIINVQRLKK